MGTASAVIIIAGKLTAHEDAEEIHENAPDPVKKSMIPMIRGFYGDNAALQRDEAIRSASLAAMTLMYAAHDAGYATSAMIGFDPDAVCKLVGLDEGHIPVMMVVLGRQVGDIQPRAPRLPLDRVVKLDRLDGAGLA